MSEHISEELHPLQPDEQEVAAGFAHLNLQGSVPSIATDEELREALEQAFDYRGDVTITRKNGQPVEGYLYDRKQGADLAGSFVRILPANGTPRQSIPFSDIAKIVFSGRDTAAGKSWEAWVRKYWEKRASGEAAGIEAEALD